MGPISLFIEDVIGVKRADAFANKLVCDFERSPIGRTGVEHYSFGKVTCDIVATRSEVVVDSNAEFELEMDGRSYSVKAGHNVIERQ